jgi:TrmH family RNA methyltransferase
MTPAQKHPTMHLEPTILSAKNEWVKSLKRLHKSSERREQHRFLVEGTHLVQEAIATGWPLEAICFENHWGDQNQVLLENAANTASNKGIVLQPVSTDVLRKLGTTDSPTSVIAIASHLHVPAPPKAALPLSIAVESLQDPGNMGSLIRIAAAAGLGPLIVSPDSVDPTNPKVLRSSAGQWFRSPPLVADLTSLLRSQLLLGIQILAASADGNSYWDWDLSVPTIFVLGNEGAGLSPELKSLASGSIAIPMANHVESLNVAVAGALLAFEAQRQRKSHPTQDSTPVQS